MTYYKDTLDQHPMPINVLVYNRRARFLAAQRPIISEDPLALLGKSLVFQNIDIGDNLEISVDYLSSFFQNIIPALICIGQPC